MICKNTIVKNLLIRLLPRLYSSESFTKFSFLPSHHLPLQQIPHLPLSSFASLRFSLKPISVISFFTSSSTVRFHNTNSSEHNGDGHFQGAINENEETRDEYKEGVTTNEYEEGETTDEWEEEVVGKPEVGDGGDGGGVVLHDVPWGEHALSIAHDILSQFSADLKLYAFKITTRGYVYVRLDKLSNEYGCPSMEELESYNHEYKKKLDEAGELGQIPDNLALEVSSPGAERLLKVPDDLDRFKDMPMHVCYVENVESNCIEKHGVFLLQSIEIENCIWKLADVKENRDPLGKGRPLSRKQKDWRLKLSFPMHKSVSLYLSG